MSHLQEVIREHHLTNEGPAGVRSLSKLARMLGYRDQQYLGQFSGGCHGDLLKLLEDNPGLVETIYDWLEENMSPEWNELLESYLTEDESSEEDEE